jgi:calmodulin
MKNTLGLKSKIKSQFLLVYFNQSSMSTLSEEKLAEYKQSFLLFDQDGDGKISAKELKNVFEKIGKNPTETELNDMLREFDSDGNGTIEFDEFVVLVTRMDGGENEEENLKAAFQVFDIDQNGFIDKFELKNIMKQLGNNFTDTQIAKMMEEADNDKDGQIDYNEFKQMMKN